LTKEKKELGMGMKILVISPPVLGTPPPDRGYSGIERVAAWLVKGLTELGHEVDLMARSDSLVPENGTLYGIKDERDIADTIKIIEDSGPGYSAILDWTHDHLLSLRRPELPIVNTSSVMSLTGSGLNPVLISRGQAAGINFKDHETKVIHYGLDLDEYPLYVGPREDYLLYLGQLIDGKRIEWACEVALATGRPLRIHGPGWGRKEYHDLLRGYEAKSNGLIRILGEIGGQEKIETLQKASVLIHPVGGADTGGGQWTEAGAICVLEALAVGAPCLTSRNGCLPEYMDGYQVGYAVDTLEEMIECMKHEAMLFSPEDCRRRAEDFTYMKMARAYSDLANQVAGGLRWNVKNAIVVEK
jgi:glycosyltransferase involved in cell wall biosynthesis